MKQLCLFLFFLFCGICDAQNLVPNPSFEDTVSCPATPGDVDKAIGWYPSSITPDYYNSCNNTNVSVPSNFAGYQYAHTGNAYCGFVCYSRNDTNAREHISCQLVSPLVTGTKYYVSFYLTEANPYYRLSCNKIGMLFSTIVYNANNPSPVSNQCQFCTDSIVQDTLNWVLIKGSFIADSNYTHLTLGGLFVDSLTDTIYHPPAYAHAYYYIDDICVSPDSLTCYSTVGINEVINKDELTLFPNPFTDKINITVKRNELTEVSLYDVTSRKILNQSFINSTTINTTQLAKGIYLYEVRNKNEVIKKGKVVKD